MRSYKILEADRAKEIVEEIKKADWSTGQSVREHGKVKKNLELRHTNEVARPYLEEILDGIHKSAILTREFVYQAFVPRFSWYKDLGEYQIHADAGFMGSTRSDLAMTLFLTDDYEGGELCIDGVLPGSRVAKFKAPAGFAVVYDCWRPHWVNPVTKGDRIVALTWIQSYVPNAEDREILNLLHSVIDDVERQEMPPQERFAKLGAVHEKLLKRFTR